MAKLVHPVSSFFTPKHDNLRISWRRDLGAALEIFPAFARLGYGYGEPILDYPPLNDGDSGGLYPVDCSFARPGDLLLQTTRPPLDDKTQNPRKRVRESFTTLERRFFDLWLNYLEHCSRLQVILHRRFDEQLSPPCEGRRHMQFRESEGAPYLKVNTGAGWRKTDGESETRTAVFLLRTNEVWEGGPGLVSAWGMDGTATTVWAYRLGRDFSSLLAEPGFVVAEMTNTGIPERPTNMRWAADWKIKILLHETFGQSFSAPVSVLGQDRVSYKAGR